MRKKREVQVLGVIEKHSQAFGVIRNIKSCFGIDFSS
jgi:hypothetical protein